MQWPEQEVGTVLVHLLLIGNRPLVYVEREFSGPARLLSHRILVVRQEFQHHRQPEVLSAFRAHECSEANSVARRYVSDHPECTLGDLL